MPGDLLTVSYILLRFASKSLGSTSGGAEVLTSLPSVDNVVGLNEVSHICTVKTLGQCHACFYNIRTFEDPLSLSLSLSHSLSPLCMKFVVFFVNEPLFGGLGTWVASKEWVRYLCTCTILAPFCAGSSYMKWRLFVHFIRFSIMSLRTNRASVKIPVLGPPLMSMSMGVCHWFWVCTIIWCQRDVYMVLYVLFIIFACMVGIDIHV